MVAMAGAAASAIRVVVFRLDTQSYAVSLDSVIRVERMVAVSPLPRAPHVCLGVVNVHGQIVPVLDLRRRLGLAPRAYGVDAQLLIARTSARTVAIPVDAVTRVESAAQLQVTPTRDIVPGIEHVEGILPIGDELLFIHDVERFLSKSEEREIQAAIEGMGDAGHA
ncbi:MAG TPA: chemotaxis protein CheW [Chloroflexota bacterium]|nr:chemotaxis protein CheW [Chloroflexota bacterium]